MMTLKINGEVVSWSDMESENLYDSLVEIQNWLITQGWRMIGYQTNFPEVDPKTVPISDISELEIQAEPLNHLLLTHLDILILWLDSLSRGLSSRNQEVRQRCLEVVEQINQSVDILTQVGIQLPKSFFQKVFIYLQQGWDQLTELANSFDQIQAQLERIKTMILYPLDSLQLVLGQIQRIVEATENLPSMLYSGQNQQAMRYLIDFLDQYALLVFALSQIKISVEMKNLLNEVVPFFSELSEAMQRMDWTYLSDLWEYEIFPRMTKLLELSNIELGKKEDAAQRS
jgi:hypothetical protein